MLEVLTNALRALIRKIKGKILKKCNHKLI